MARRRSQSDANANSPSPVPPNLPLPNVPLARTRSSTGTPSVRIRRLPSSNSVTLSRQTTRQDAQTEQRQQQDAPAAGRRRSSSEPQEAKRANVSTSPSIPEIREPRNNPSALTSVAEEAPGESRIQPMRFPTARGASHLQVPGAADLWPTTSGRRRGDSRASSRSAQSSNAEYPSQVMDVLDVIDPEVSTLTTLNNVQNSLFVPYLGSWLNRTPTYNLSRPTPTRTATTEPQDEAEVVEAEVEEVIDAEKAERPEDFEREEYEPYEPSVTTTSEERRAGLARLHTLKSNLTGTSTGHNFAVLPHGTVLEGWTEEDKDELNDYVRHLLHSRKERFKRSMRGFGKFVRKPLGAFVTIYAFLLTFWGAAWVLFLIGWISVGDRQAYFVEICDQILTALFCLVGLGLAPFRAVDTYHMIYIAHYHYLTWRLRREKGLPELEDKNELPDARDNDDVELAQEKSTQSVLTEAQQRKLKHHQDKFCKSHTFYKPHETFTHRAFSVKLLIAIVVLLDCHSLFQMALGSTTWGINYHHRPKALTAVILSCSICCNISGGITISVGDHRSRKKKIIEQIFRQNVTKDALKKLKKRKGLETSNSAEDEEKETAPAKKSRLAFLGLRKEKGEKIQVAAAGMAPA